MSVLEQFRLDGRVALVTGGTKGLGRSMAIGIRRGSASMADPSPMATWSITRTATRSTTIPPTLRL